MTGALLASAQLLPFHLNWDPGLLGEGLGSTSFQTAKVYSNESSVRGKGRAIGWILKLLLGHTALALHRENQAACASILGMQLHTQTGSP